MFWQIFAAGIGFGSMGAAMAYYRHWKANRPNVYYIPGKNGEMIDAIVPWERRAKIALWVVIAAIIILGLRSLDGSWPFGPTGFL